MFRIWFAWSNKQQEMEKHINAKAFLNLSMRSGQLPKEWSGEDPDRDREIEVG